MLLRRALSTARNPGSQGRPRPSCGQPRLLPRSHPGAQRTVRAITARRVAAARRAPSASSNRQSWVQAGGVVQQLSALALHQGSLLSLGDRPARRLGGPDPHGRTRDMRGPAALGPPGGVGSAGIASAFASSPSAVRSAEAPPVPDPSSPSAVHPSARREGARRDATLGVRMSRPGGRGGATLGSVVEESPGSAGQGGG